MSKNPEAVTCTARLLTRSVNNLSCNKQTITVQIYQRHILCCLKIALTESVTFSRIYRDIIFFNN